MTGRIIKLHAADHEEAEMLLPWYATGQLDAAEKTRVEAHLSTCPDCAAELRAERRLGREITGLSIDVNPDWLGLRRQIERDSSTQPDQANPLLLRIGARMRRMTRVWRGRHSWVVWAVAAQFTLIVMGGVVFAPRAQPARYHALGTAASSPLEDAIVMFRPDTSEARLRLLLTESHARVVDGPTAAGAYVLYVPLSERKTQLAALKRHPEIILAEPIDGEGPS